jgi:hypothetical protein
LLNFHFKGARLHLQSCACFVLNLVLDADTVPSSSSLLSSSTSLQPTPPASSSLAVLHANIMNERICSLFIEVYPGGLGMDGSGMAVTLALAFIDTALVTSSSTAVIASALPPTSLLALIDQETPAITNASPQARVTSLASKII